MAHSEPSPSTDAETTTADVTATYETGLIPTEESGLSGRRESAHTEHMVAVPQFDEYGVAYTLFDVTTESGSHYEASPYGSGNCPDMTFNNPSDGCKHVHRVVLRLQAGDIPEPDEEVHEYMTERVPELVESFAAELSQLRQGRDDPESADDREAFEEAIGEVETFITTLAEHHADYRNRVDEDEPTLSEKVDTDADLSGLLAQGT